MENNNSFYEYNPLNDFRLGDIPIEELKKILSDLVNADMISMCWEDNQVKYYMSSKQRKDHIVRDYSQFEDGI